MPKQPNQKPDRQANGQFTKAKPKVENQPEATETEPKVEDQPEVRESKPLTPNHPQVVPAPERRLRGNELVLEDYALGRWYCPVPAGTMLKHVLHPYFFKAERTRLKPGQLITVISEDNELEVQVRVLRVEIAEIAVRVCSIVAEPGKDHIHPSERAARKEIGTLDQYWVEWGGQSHKFRVMLGDVVIETNFATRGEAEKRRDQYIEAR